MSEPFNDLKQVEMSIKAAQKMVGSATMSMDHEQLDEATQAIQDARQQLAHAQHNGTGVDDEFLQQQQTTLTQCEEQLNEAKQ
jgi:septum formation inhibitor MinC